MFDPQQTHLALIYYPLLFTISPSVCRLLSILCLDVVVLRPPLINYNLRGVLGKGLPQIQVGVSIFERCPHLRSVHLGGMATLERYQSWRSVHYAPINSKLQHPPPPRAFDCASCLGRGEFELCVGRVGNLNRIYLLF